MAAETGPGRFPPPIAAVFPERFLSASGHGGV